MNLLMMAVGTTGGASMGSTGVMGDACALFLFVSGTVSMMIAGYLLYKAPKAQPVRYYTRKH